MWKELLMSFIIEEGIIDVICVNGDIKLVEWYRWNII